MCCVILVPSSSSSSLVLPIFEVFGGFVLNHRQAVVVAIGQAQSQFQSRLQFVPDPAVSKLSIGQALNLTEPGQQAVKMPPPQAMYPPSGPCLLRPCASRFAPCRLPLEPPPIPIPIPPKPNSTYKTLPIQAQAQFHLSLTPPTLPPRPTFIQTMVTKSPTGGYLLKKARRDPSVPVHHSCYQRQLALLVRPPENALLFSPAPTGREPFKRKIVSPTTTPRLSHVDMEGLEVDGVDAGSRPGA